jgi:hypothetical protein
VVALRFAADSGGQFCMVAAGLVWDIVGDDDTCDMGYLSVNLLGCGVAAW